MKRKRKRNGKAVGIIEHSLAECKEPLNHTLSIEKALSLTNKTSIPFVECVGLFVLFSEMELPLLDFTHRERKQTNKGMKIDKMEMETGTLDWKSA